MVISCPTRAEARAAHRDAALAAALAADGSGVTIQVSGIASPYRLRAWSAKLGTEANAPEGGGAFGAGEPGSVTLPLR